MNKRIQAMADECFDVMPDPDYLKAYTKMVVDACARIAELKEQGYGEFDKNLSAGWYMRVYFGTK